MAKTNFTDGITAVVAAWLNKVFDHVHDGVDDDGHAPKVHLSDHIDYDGDPGADAGARLEVTTDDGSVHEITHESGGATTARFVGDQIEASDRVESSELRPANGDTVQVNSDSGGAGYIQAEGFKGNLGVQFLDSAGNLTDAFAEVFEATTRLVSSTLRAGTGDSAIEIQADNGDPGAVTALNTAKARVRVAGDGTLKAGYGATVTRGSTGIYTISLSSSASAADEIAVVVTAQPDSVGSDFYVPGAWGTGVDEVTIEIKDNAGNLVDVAWSAVVHF
jgi:hypothetical protein